MAQHVFTGSGAPATTPTAVGQHYIDTTNDQSYISVGTASSADWVNTGAGATWGFITGTLSSQTDLQTALDARLEKASNLSDLVNAATARTNLGLGSVATENTVPIAKGGTGQTTANAGLNALLPTQTGNSGKVLSTDGTDTSWVTPAGSAVWGAITGTLSSQTDLQTALDAKAAKAANLSDLTNVATARSNLGLGDCATENILPISKGGTGQSNATAALNNLLPTQSGNSGKFLSTDGSNANWSDPLPSQTGNAGKFLSTDGSTTSWDTPPAAPTGTPNNVTGFDGSGDIYSINGWQINTFSGAQFNQTWQPDTPDTGQTLHNFSLQVDPVDNAPDAAMNVLMLQANVDPNDTGFEFGTNGNAIRLANLYGDFRGTGDVGELNFINQSFDMGDGTNPISVRGLSYAYGFGQINAGVTMVGPLQGYGFQPSVNASATLDAGNNAYVTAFYDNANIGCEANAYTSYNAGPQIASIANNSNYNGLNINPTITTFTGNSGANLIAVGGNFTTLNSGTINCFNANPNVTLNKGSVYGLNVTMDNVTNYAGVQASIVIQDITYEFIQAGSFNNNYQIEYLDDTTAGSESVSIVGLLISVHMESGVSTATQIAAAAAANLTFAGAVTTTITGTPSNPQVSAAAANFTGGIDPGRKVAGNFDGDVAIDGSLSFTGGLSIGALSAFGTLAMSSGTGSPVSIHTLITQPTVAASATLTNADLLGVNTAMLLNVGDNATVTTGFLGLQALGLPAVVTMGAGSTVDHVGGAAFAISLDAGAGGGTIAEVDLCSALAIPNGSTTVTELRGYFFDLPFGSVGTTHWGLYSKPSTAINYMAGSCVVGTSDTPTNSSVGIELNATDKAILLPRMDSTAEGALTAVNGMIIYNTTTNKFRGYENGAWVDLV